MTSLGPIALSDKNIKSLANLFPKIGSLNRRITLKYDRCINSTAADELSKFLIDSTILNTGPTAGRLCEILQ